METLWADPGTRLRRMRLMAPVILKASALTGEVKERLMALCYRESLCTFALDPPGSVVGWGDNGNAFGPFQVDKRYHADFIKAELGRYAWAVKEGQRYDAQNQANYACQVLRDARYWIKKNSGLSSDPLERATYAAYNAGPYSVVSATRTGAQNVPLETRVDMPTTGKNYSASIFSMASILQRPEYQWIWH